MKKKWIIVVPLLVAPLATLNAAGAPASKSALPSILFITPMTSSRTLSDSDPPTSAALKKQFPFNRTT